MRSLKRHRYGAIYADPPWSFRNWSDKGTGRNAISHYDCLNFETLAGLPVADMADSFARRRDPDLSLRTLSILPTNDASKRGS
jgi:hypothetical protein